MVSLGYWIVSGVLLLWNALGCFACFSQLTARPEKLAALPEAQRDAWLAMPIIAKAAYVAAVVSGLLGTVALLLRCAAAGPLFVASLIGVIVQFGWFFLIYRAASRFGAASLAFPGFIAIVALLQIGFACWAKQAGLLS